MYNRKTIAQLALLACAVGAGIVVACGPDFPAQLLDDRVAALHSTPANSFSYEVSRLLAPGDALRAQESYTLPDGSYRQDAIPEDFDPALSPAQRETVRMMRTMPDGDQAYAAGAALPLAIRLYAAAAVDLRAAAQGTAEPALSRAQARLRAIAALPPEQGAARSVWAAYMLADAGLANSGEVSSAPSGYARARQLAREGAPDPLGLAVASFGQEARQLLRGSQGDCTYADFMEASACADAIPAQGLKQAIRLYAEQAARGSASGQASLRLIASWALGSPSRAARLIDNPIARRLLVAYALARVGDIVDGDPDSAYDLFATYEINGQRGYADAAALAAGQGGGKVTPNPALQTLAAALASQDLSQVQDADRVAALAYRVGRYDLAEALAKRIDTHLAWWVRAKLAIRAGDMPRAAQAYARASGGFPAAGDPAAGEPADGEPAASNPTIGDPAANRPTTSVSVAGAPADAPVQRSRDDSIDAAGIARLKAEHGVLALSRGQYVEALDLLLHANAPDTDTETADAQERWPLSPYWNDAAYVAERVLTVDELKRYVDQQVPASAAPATPPGLLQADDSQIYSWTRQHPIPDGDRLRSLLARRLVREGRVEQALAYFPQDTDARYANLVYNDGAWRVALPNSRQKAADYGAAIRQAGNAWGRTARAQAWFAAARIARRDGLDIMGYEQAPDYAVYGGNYTYGAGRNAESWGQQTDDGTRQTPQTPAQRAEAALPGPLVTDGERQRYAASEARPNARFHYRQIAADHALQAAGQLPNRSQAFAAVLCQGTRYIIDDDPERASAMYLRYIEQGAQVPFSGTFGRECAEPDFRAAAWFHYTQAWKAWERLRRDHAGLLWTAGLIVLAAGGAYVLAWRNREPMRPEGKRDEA